MTSREGARQKGRDGVLFFGCVAAGLSHEISNILNIINELAGLQHDIAVGASDGGDARVARLADLAGRIKAQVARGEEINRRLHGLAHSVDDPVTAVDLGQLLALLAFLEARPARLGGVGLDVRLPERPVSLIGDPFALLLALHGAITAALRSAGSGGRVEVTTEASAGETRIRVGCSAVVSDGGGDTPAASALRAGAAAWGAAVTAEPNADTPRTIVLAVPSAAPGARPNPAAPPTEEDS